MDDIEIYESEPPTRAEQHRELLRQEAREAEDEAAAEAAGPAPRPAFTVVDDLEIE
jgi:hypothetical protein